MTKQRHISLEYRQKSAARLAAVQTFYDMEITHISIAEALKNCVYYQDQEKETDQDLVRPNMALVETLAKGAWENLSMIDKVIESSLTIEWKITRLDKVLLSILRLGVAELYLFPNTHTPVIISEYVDVSRAFYDQKEPGLVNGVLQKASDILRS